jgi:hypothetical protein
MAERQTVAQVQQIGKEVTPGTAVAATRRLGSITLTPGVEAEAEMFMPAGAKFATVQSLNREWVSGDISGTPTYEEIIYPLAGAVGAPTTSQLMDGGTPTGAYQHVFTPATAAADTPVTFTLEQGDAVQAEKMAHLLFTGFSLDINRAGIGLGGSFFAQALTRSIVMTAGLGLPTNIVPILPGHVTVSTAATFAGLSGGASLTRVISANPSIGDKFAPAWFVNAAQPSFTTYVEPAEGPTSEFAMAVEADATGMAYLDLLRSGATAYLRVQAKGGPNIYNAGTQLNLQRSLTWDMAVKVKDADTWSDSDGIFGIPLTMQMVHDTTATFSQKVTVVNSLSTL